MSVFRSARSAAARLAPQRRRIRGGSLRRRLYGAFAAIVVLLLVTSGVALATLDQLAASTSHIIEVSDPKERAAADVRFDLSNTYGLETAYVLGDQVAMRKAYEESYTRLTTNLARLRAVSTTDAERKIVERIADKLSSFGKNDRQVWIASKGGSQEMSINTLERNQRPLHATMQTSVSEYIALAREAQASDVSAFGRTRGQAQRIVLGLGGATLLVAALLAWLVTRSITRPMLRTVEVLESVAGGDLRRRLDVSRRDEIGRMGEALNVTLEKLRSVFGSVVGSAETLASAAEQLTAVSHQMASSAEETSAQANAVSHAAEQVSGDVQIVAAATAQMSGSIREVSEHAARAADVATQGTELAEQANGTMARLGEASGQIGDITRMISMIAEQTNLLALNATIEAARAGDAGRGFAVVAVEVKELSSETGQASSDITGRITAIQGSAAEAAQSIDSIGEIIGRINESQVTIASAVEEQTVTTSAIGSSVTNAAEGAAEIARSMAGVAEAAQATTQGASETQRAAGDLAVMAASLRELVDQFQV